MNDSEMRLECLKIVSSTMLGAKPERVLEAAEQYWQFVKHATRGKSESVRDTLEQSLQA